MKVLIIDDNSAVRTTLKLLLSKRVDEVASVGDPTLIPALLSGGNIDVILLDMNFDNDNLDGGEGLFWLRNIKSRENAPAVVLITAFGDIDLAVEAMKSGAEDFVTKPWNNDDLIAKIYRAAEKNLKQRSGRQTLREANEIKTREELSNTLTLDEIKHQHAQKIVDMCGGNISAAAERLGVNRQTLYNILKRK